MPKTTPVQRLRNLNSLLTAMNPCGPEQAGEIRKAVEFFIDEVQQQEPEGDQFPAFAEEILNIHVTENSNFGLCFWCVNVAEKEPLWLRQAFLDKLESLSGYPRATLVIFGLQETVVSDQKYWTKALESRYAETRNFLERLAAEYQETGKQLNLIYI